MGRALVVARAGFTTRVLADLTAAVAPDQLPVTLAELRQAGVAVVTTRPGAAPTTP